MNDTIDFRALAEKVCDEHFTNPKQPMIEDAMEIALRDAYEAGFRDGNKSGYEECKMRYRLK